MDSQRERVLIETRITIIKRHNSLGIEFPTYLVVLLWNHRHVNRDNPVEQRKEFGIAYGKRDGGILRKLILFCYPVKPIEYHDFLTGRLWLPKLGWRFRKSIFS